MAKQFKHLEPEHREFISRQSVFFTASAAPTGHINLSPKGLHGLRVLDANTVVYLDLTGSGNETAAHIRIDGRLTLMFCAFEGPPLILRIYGRGHTIARGTSAYKSLLAGAFDIEEPVGARQITRVDIDLVQTSCGYGVPLLHYQGQRPSLDNWAKSKGEEGLKQYRREKNTVSIDGFATGLTPED
ncbi:MAG: pyridoxamine 5'-phosphate oxidase family protein [Alphaproteobacteria bacterium]|nr:pyridoxamine 5'-phosphate oxidase family protein [Alphaproteobacteria bacterium]